MSEETYFAPAERNNIDQILADYQRVKDNARFQLINLLNIPTLILNENRQIVLYNDVVAEILNVESPDQVLGKRPGEALSCANSQIMKAGCGTSQKCASCGAVMAIWESQKKREKITNECLLSCSSGDEELSLEFEVTVSPISISEKTFYVLTLLDISEQKRKQMIERIFFHDLLNLTGGLTGILDLYMTGGVMDMKEMLSVIEMISKDMVEQIHSQRDLLNAEKKILVPNLHRILTCTLINELTEELSNQPVARGKYLINDTEPDLLEVESDLSLLKRVLTNMIKNALEAEPEGSHIFFSCKKEGEDHVCFYVMNPSYIPEKVQYNIFKRSFSTKGAGRGLGTYSMKLLTEKYLDGEVSFVSTPTEGTTFNCIIPLSKKKD
ncbi:MAG: HAMP domain-containing histidine kinase [Bacteroidales bacterium]|nr:HAMP domain-containing histidine kinase [Bacteroidales bacterium]